MLPKAAERQQLGGLTFSIDAVHLRSKFFTFLKVLSNNSRNEEIVKGSELDVLNVNEKCALPGHHLSLTLTSR